MTSTTATTCSRCRRRSPRRWRLPFDRRQRARCRRARRATRSPTRGSSPVAGPAIDKGTVVHARRRHRGRRRGGDRAGRRAGRRRHRADGLSRPHRHGQHRGGRSRPARRCAAAAGGGWRPAAVAPPWRRPMPITWADQEREARARYPQPRRRRGRRSSRSKATTCGGSPRPASPRRSRSRRRASSAGQSALVNVTAPPDPTETSALADYRRGLVVVQVAGRAARRLCDRSGRRRRRRLSRRAARRDRVRAAVVPRRAVAEGRARVCRAPQGRARRRLRAGARRAGAGARPQDPGGLRRQRGARDPAGAGVRQGVQPRSDHRRRRRGRRT